MKQLWFNQNGYALVLAFIFMPVFLGFSLLAFDLSRGNNAHSDLQAAADALALAGARELNGRTGSIDSARAAMALLTNRVHFLDSSASGRNIPLVYENVDGNEFTVIFLKDIPDSDDDPIDQAFVDDEGTTDGTLANYVYVRAQSRDLNTFFPVNAFLSTADGDVALAATAVATYLSAACDVTPVFICNPFEASSTPDINENFSQGNFYARQLSLQFTGNASPFPGNFGFLRTLGQGGRDLGEALAIGRPDFCFSRGKLLPEPGATVGQVENGMNVRMGLYSGNFGQKDNDPVYRPAQNVRKGQETGGNQCKNYSEAADPFDALALPEGDGTPITLPGGAISQDNDWNLDLYWDVTHSGQDPHPLDPRSSGTYDPAYVVPSAPAAAIKSTVSSYPGGTTPVSAIPSRYDVYRYEISQSLTGSTAPNGESGDSMCHKGYDLASFAGGRDRRLIFGAIVNCNEHADDINGASASIPAEAFGSFFMTKPVITSGPNKFISLELIDVTGPGSNGTLENFLREEAVLVR